MVDLGRAVKAPFNDSDWVKKTLLGFLWVLLTVTMPAVYGAQLDYIRSVARDDERLPDWDDFGRKWVDGFMIWLAGFIYFLPVVVMGIVLVAPALFSLISSGGEATDVFGALFAGGFCISMLIGVIYSVAVSILFSAATVHYAMSGSFGAFFEFGAIMSKVRSGSGYWTAWLYTILIAFAGSVATSILSATGVGGILYPAVVYLMAMMTGHVLGQWARDAYAVAPVAAPLAPPAYPQAQAAPPVHPQPQAAPPVYPEPQAPPAEQPAVPPVYPEPQAPPAEEPPAPPAYTEPEADAPAVEEQSGDVSTEPPSEEA